MRSNVLNYLVESNVGFSCEAIEVDLAGKIVYDDPSVFRRLRVREVDDDVVATCADTLKLLYASDISLLKELAEQASEQSPDALEVEELGDKRSDNNTEKKSGNHGSLEEKGMYDPLVRLFNHVTTFGHTVRPRSFTKTNCMLKADEPHTFGFPSTLAPSRWLWRSEAVQEPRAHTFESTLAIKRGTAMTGTAQFMARNILSPRGGQGVVHQACHDVESFIWVLSFCVMRNVQLRAINKTAPDDVHAQSKAFRTMFHRAFDATSDDIENQRHSLSHALTFPISSKVDRVVANFMTSSLCALFYDLQNLVHAALAPRHPDDLTHEALLAVVDKAIASLDGLRT